MTDFPALALGPFKRKPRQKQLEALSLSASAPYFALFMEMRTGKSQVILDTAAYHYRNGRINALLIIAPSGVHTNWVREEIPAALPDDTNYRCVIWRATKIAAKSSQDDLAALLIHPGLAVLSVNIDAIITKNFKAYINKFIKNRILLTVLDESLDISSPGSKRTKAALTIGKFSKYRRILDGTPVAAKPFGLYSQCNFLKPGLLGFTSYLAFKRRYAEWEEGTTYVGGMQRSYPILKKYTNLDELTNTLKSFSFRVLRSDCADLPPKIYEKRFFELSPRQRRVYDDLKSEYTAELSEQDNVTADHVLTRYLRLQQISSNFAPIDTDSMTELPDDLHENVIDNSIYSQYVTAEIHPLLPAPAHSPTWADKIDTTQAGTAVIDPASNPRLETLLSVLTSLSGQGIIWARFKHDINLIMEALGPDAIRYDGSVSTDDRTIAITKFRAGQAKYFVGNARAGGRGLDLSAANFVIYYSHDWPLRWRLQSEDRAQSLAKKDSVLYIDIIAEDTVDERIVSVLRQGKNLSDMIMGDPHQEWI